MCQFKRQEPLANNPDLTVNDSSSCKYKSNLLKNATAEDGNAVWKNAQIIVPLKYISSFFRSLELPLISTKLYIQLNCTKNSVISNAEGNSTFKITKTELYVPAVTLKTEDNNKLNQILDTEFKRTVYWNEYKSKIEDVIQLHNNNNYKRTLLDVAIPGINRLFVMRFNNNDALNNIPAGDEDAVAANNNTHTYRVQGDSHKKYFLPRVDIKDYNVLIEGRNFYDQNISDDFKKYEELRN